MIVINYGALIYRIKECGFSQSEVAQKIGISATSLSLKVNNKAQFTQGEILKLSELLELDLSEVGFYFFTKKFNVHEA